MTSPTAEFVTRTVAVGGQSKESLLAELARAGVELNDAARTLFASDQFITSDTPRSVITVEVTVGQLGFAAGAGILELHDRAATLGLGWAPLELGPHLRLQYLDQPEGSTGFPVTQHCAPPGSLTVASPPPSDDDAFPKGFYLRRIAGRLWLRGYWSDRAHIWSPADHLIFLRPQPRTPPQAATSRNRAPSSY